MLSQFGGDFFEVEIVLLFSLCLNFLVLKIIRKEKRYSRSFVTNYFHPCERIAQYLTSLKVRTNRALTSVCCMLKLSPAYF